MHIVNHPRCKDNIQDESSARLPVACQADARGQWNVSYWKPSAVELESLITGGGVELRIKAVAEHHPVVSVATWPAIGPELIDGDPFMQRTTGYRCFGCCAKEGQPHVEHCINLMKAIQFSRSNLTRDSDSCEPIEVPPLSYPPDLAAVLQSALTFMELRTGPLVEIFRAAGHEIAVQRTAEEAFLLSRIMRAVLIHGDKWARVFAAQLRVAQDAAIEMHEAAEHRKSA